MTAVFHSIIITKIRYCSKRFYFDVSRKLAVWFYWYFSESNLHKWFKNQIKIKSTNLHVFARFAPWSCLNFYSRWKSMRRKKLFFSLETNKPFFLVKSVVCSCSVVCFIQLVLNRCSGLISPTFYTKLLQAQIPKGHKIQSSRHFLRFGICMPKSCL